jgi:PAS domain S-box-containing protein
MDATVTREGWEPLFWRVFEQSRNAMLLLDGARVHRSVNPAAVELFGYSREELIGMRLDDLYRPDDRPLLVARWDRFMRRGEPYTGRRVIVCAGGRLVDVEAALHTEVVTGLLRTLCVILHHEAVEAHDVALDAGADDPLTPREREIVHLLALGLSGPEVAEQLFISHDTVRTHVRNAMEKVAARTRAQLVAIALGQGALATN